MLPRKFIDYLLVGLASLLVVAIAWVFFPGALDQWPRALTLGQKMETSIQLMCGPLGILAILISIFVPKYGALSRTIWGISLFLMALLSALVWGPPMVLPAVLFSAASLAIAYGVSYAFRRLETDKPLQS